MVTVMLDLLMANVDVFAWGYNAFAKAQEEVRMHLVTHSPCQRCSPATTSGNSCFATPRSWAVGSVLHLSGPSASATALLHVWALATVGRQQQRSALCEALPSPV